MAMTVEEVMLWLNNWADDALVAIDDGGLALVLVGQEDAAYLEVGGIPEDEVG